MKNKKLIIIVGIIAVASVGIYLIFRGMKKKDEILNIDEVDTTIPNGTTKTTTQTTTTTKSNVIQFGNKNASVGYIQQYLNKKYNAGLVVDYIFGNKTLSALKKYENVSTVGRELFVKMAKYLGKI